jgi:uncharacterized DUF497 family protein
MFVWDEAKRLKVIENHKVDFALLLDVFDDAFGVYFEDVEHSSENEIRFNLIGFAAQYGLIYVTFTHENNDIRLITAWKAEKWMVKEYEQYKK